MVLKKLSIFVCLLFVLFFLSTNLVFGITNDAEPIPQTDHNATAPLSITTYDQSNQLTHPDVVYVEKGWNSFKYWMVFTPYPFGDNKYTNPSIRVSNDGFHWRKPSALLPDPIVQPPADSKEGGYNSDPDIELAGETMFMFFRVTTAQKVTAIYFKTSTDGIKWSPRQLTKLPVTATSPAFTYDGKVFHCWYVDYAEAVQEPFAVKYCTSSNGIEWSQPVKIYLPTPGYTPWHLNVTKTDLGYEMLLTAYPIGSKHGKSELFHAWSLDKSHWALSSQRPLLKAIPGSWDSKQIYRSAMVKDGDGYKIWYSAADLQNHWQIGMTTLKEIPCDTDANNINLTKTALNARMPLHISTYDGFNQLNHPDVLYLEKGWNSFKYWMVFTPYTSGNSKSENPSFRVSNDGTHWQKPSPQLADPLVSAPSDFKEGGFNSDPDIIMVGDTMYMYYRTTIAQSLFLRQAGQIITTVYLKTSTDGVKWSPSRITNLPSATASPAMYYDGNMFYCWYVEYTGFSHEPYAIRYCTSQNGIEWSPPVEVSLAIEDYTPWHLNVIKSDLGYEMLLTAYPLHGNSGQTVLFYARSSDKLHWTLASQKPLLKPILGSWDSKQIYRSTMVKDGDGYKIWYPAADLQNNWRVGLITMKEIPWDTKENEPIVPKEPKIPIDPKDLKEPKNELSIRK